MRKKFLVTLCTILCLASTTSVFAKDYTAPTDNAEVPIDFTMESLFTVTLPENIQGKATKEVNFNYSVEGNIASNELVTVKPENSTFTLSDITSKTIDANVSIPKTDFRYTEIVTKNTQEGTVSVVNLPAGKWDGICKFLINLDTLPTEKAAGMYDADGNLIASLSASQMLDFYLKYRSIPTVLGIDASSIYEVVLPNEAVVPFNCFNGCVNLQKVTIPSSYIAINGGAFAGCTNLEVTVPSSIDEISSTAFTNVKHVYYEGTATGSPWGANAIN